MGDRTFWRLVRTPPIILLLATAVACGDDPANVCDAASLTAALASSTNVQVGACTIEGAFSLRAGTILRGTAGTTLVAPADRPALTFEPGSGGTTEVHDLAVTAGGIIGVLARGDAHVSMTNVDVNVSHGIGLGFEDLPALALEDVRVTGTITRGNILTTPPAQAPIFGLVILDVTSSALTRVEITGLARYGAFIANGTTTWTGGGVSESGNVGLLMYGGTATLSGLEFEGAIRGPGFEPAYGAVFAAGAQISAMTLTASRSDDYGVLVDRSSGTITGAAISANENSGLRVQTTTDLEIDGTFADNGRVAILALDSTNVRVSETTVSGTRLRPTLSGGQNVDIGDGIQLVRSSTGAQLDRVTLAANERAGVLVELGGATLERATFSDVEVTASSTAYGVIVQGGNKPAGWDSGIARLGTAAANDASIARLLETVEGVGPCWMPPPDVLSTGLQALIGF